MRSKPVIPAKAGIQTFVKYRDMDTGFRQYDSLWVFWDRVYDPPLQVIVIYSVNCVNSLWIIAIIALIASESLLLLS